MLAATETPTALPDMKVSVRQVFGIDSDLEVPAYRRPTSTFRTSIPTISSTARRRSPSSPGSPATAA